MVKNTNKIIIPEKLIIEYQNCGKKYFGWIRWNILGIKYNKQKSRSMLINALIGSLDKWMLQSRKENKSIDILLEDEAILSELIVEMLPYASQQKTQYLAGELIKQAKIYLGEDDCFDLVFGKVKIKNEKFYFHIPKY